MSVRIDVSEVDALARDISSGSARAEERAQLAVAKTALAIEADAQALSPVDTGALKSSISSTVGSLEAEIGPTVDYGIYVHEGTSRMAGRPFLANAFDRRLPGLEQALTQIGADLL